MNKILYFLKKHSVFCIAAMLTVIRFFLWDYQYLFDLLLPKHDGLHGVAAFATSMHSIRMGNGIAWWNPAETNGGWAQYYSGFLSPLAPTYGSVGFILCGGLVRILSIFHIVIPEYYLYIVINHIFYPFLACFFLLKLFHLFWENAYVDIFVGGGYFFGGIGLQIDSWYYYQDQFYMFLLLFGILSLLENISGRTYKRCLCIMLLFLAAANYWSVHNLVFILMVLIVYIMWKENLCDYIKKCIQGIWKVLKSEKWFTAAFVVVSVIWVVLIVSVYAEQCNFLPRPGSDGTGGFSENEAFERALTANPSFWTVELANPVVGSWQVEQNNYIHNARYIGVGVFVCAVLSLLFLNKKKIRMFWTLCVIMLLVCMVPGFMLPVWKLFLSFDRHFFLFYAHFLELSFLFLGGGCLYEIIEVRKGTTDDAIKRILLILVFFAVILFLLGFLIPSFSQETKRSIFLLSVLVILSSGCLFFFKKSGDKRYLILYLLIFFTDITRYYYECSMQDYIFTESFFQRESSGSIDVAKCFQGEENNTFKQNIVALSPPLWNYLWPSNNYMPSRKSVQYANMLNDPQFVRKVDRAIEENAVLFYNSLSEYNGITVFDRGQRMDGEYTITEYGYNDFLMKVKPGKGGYVLFGMPYDALWEITVDGKKADVQCADVKYMYIAIEPGEHEIELHYRPFARRIYGAAVVLAILMIIIFIRERNGKNEGCNSCRRIWNTD